MLTLQKKNCGETMRAFYYTLLKNCFYYSACLALFSCTACSSKPQHGPDKQFGGTLAGAASGAGTGAITGFHLGAGSGPGALAGAGLGAVAGGVHGAVRDSVEESLLKTSAELQKEREIAIAHETLQDHYRRRMELHPARDIYPAEYFFDADQIKVRCSAKALIREIAALNKKRYPWSRLIVAMYIKADNENSEYAQHLVEGRARALGDALVRAGLEPRRIETRAVIVPAPILIDPLDAPDRYNQAVELIPVDR
ncbi:MAG: hypothetical protein ACOX2O_09815 [Bdellovibrionota bacterium]